METVAREFPGRDIVADLADRRGLAHEILDQASQLLLGSDDMIVAVQRSA